MFGRIIDTERFDASRSDYRSLLGWMNPQGELVRVGIEETCAYGAGLCRHLVEAGIEIVDVNEPNRQLRRRHGKSDTADAEAAARAVLNSEATPVLKAVDGESLDANDPGFEISAYSTGAGMLTIVVTES